MCKRSNSGTCLTTNALGPNAQSSFFLFVSIAVDHFLY